MLLHGTQRGDSRSLGWIANACTRARHCVAFIGPGEYMSVLAASECGVTLRVPGRTDW
jgi:hypothetical protein